MLKHSVKQNFRGRITPQPHFFHSHHAPAQSMQIMESTSLSTHNPVLYPGSVQRTRTTAFKVSVRIQSCNFCRYVRARDTNLCHPKVAQQVIQHIFSSTVVRLCRLGGTFHRSQCHHAPLRSPDHQPSLKKSKWTVETLQRAVKVRGIPFHREDNWAKLFSMWPFCKHQKMQMMSRRGHPLRA